MKADSAAQRALVIVPTYNEAETSSAWCPAILAQSAPLDVLIVDDALAGRHR